MPAVPDNLQARFEKWDANGRPPQAAFTWNKSNWQNYLGEQSVLDTLHNPIDRAGVLGSFKNIQDPATALDAYIASYLWGYAGTGFGPYRAERVIRLNTDAASDRDFATDLHTLARIAMNDGGNAAFEHVVTRRSSDRHFFKRWGPAFATKFISFATKASENVATTPIMDSIVATSFRNYCKEAGPLWLNWNSAGSYRRYTASMAAWAQELSIEPEQVEQLIFARES